MKRNRKSKSLTEVESFHNLSSVLAVLPMSTKVELKGGNSVRRGHQVLLGLLTLLVASCSPKIDVPHTTEEITFVSGDFHIVGELRRVSSDSKCPVVIMVHGDGPATSTKGGSYFPLMERFLRAGYACFSYDKPGYGRSTGKLDRKQLRHQRAEILVDAIDVLKRHPSIDSGQIGLWGISQAGYVMPLALKATDGISFMIAVSCPGADGIEQSAYLVGQQVLCAGYSEDEASRMERLFAVCCKAQTYEEYAEAAGQLVENPAVPRDMIAGVLPEEDWSPRDPDDEGFLDPMEILEYATMPVLAFFGEKDTQVDPHQGKAAYEAALRKAGNTHFRVELILGVDHDMILCQTGCMEERQKRSWREWLNFAPEYLDLMEEWLKRLPELTR